MIDWRDITPLFPGEPLHISGHVKMRYYLYFITDDRGKPFVVPYNSLEEMVRCNQNALGSAFTCFYRKT